MGRHFSESVLGNALTLCTRLHLCPHPVGQTSRTELPFNPPNHCSACSKCPPCPIVHKSLLDVAKTNIPRYFFTYHTRGTTRTLLSQVHGKGNTGPLVGDSCCRLDEPYPVNASLPIVPKLFHILGTTHEFCKM